MNKEKCRLIFERFSLENPNPQTELNYKSVFELLIAVILSAQATDVSVNKSTVKLFAAANRPETILSIGESTLKQYIKSIGLYNSKAANIIATSKLLCAQHNSTVPKTRIELERLPGVGRKTANVILNTAFGHPVIAVDTHIFRVARRIGLAQGETPLQVEQELQTLVPAKYKQDAHHWLILHGRYICRARQPMCNKCVIMKLCNYPNKNQ